MNGKVLTESVQDLGQLKLRLSYHTRIVSPVCEAYYYGLFCVSQPNLNLNIIIDNWNIMKPKTPITETNIRVNMYYSRSKSLFPALQCNTSYIIATYSDLSTFTHFLLDSHICPTLNGPLQTIHVVQLYQGGFYYSLVILGYV